MSLTRHGGGEEVTTTPALEMLDEYWFFSNTLGKNGRRQGGRGESRPPRSPATAKGKEEGGETSRLFASGIRRLLRTPSLPSPRVGMGMSTSSSKDDDDEEEEVVADESSAAAAEEDDEMNWSSIYEGVLRTRIAEEGVSVRSALRRAPSMPVSSSSAADDGRRDRDASTTTPAMSRLRHAHSTMERHCRSHTPTKAERTPKTSRNQAPRRELRSFSANQQPLVRHESMFEDKKWKSSSDLESIEVQGFRDLGFVFDQEDLRESLADVLPGLRGGSDNDDANTNTNTSTNSAAAMGVRRPYLSESWYHVRRPAATTAAVRLQKAEARSAAEMKDKLRMWAQAVACNVRQEC
uniref:Uncharacterized protein n=1 Tax=Leersia perrieri TaxID=77586 RepID=A0A0D9UYV6_9ORYZ